MLNLREDGGQIWGIWLLGTISVQNPYPRRRVMSQVWWNRPTSGDSADLTSFQKPQRFTNTPTLLNKNSCKSPKYGKCELNMFADFNTLLQRQKYARNFRFLLHDVRTPEMIEASLLSSYSFDSFVTEYIHSEVTREERSQLHKRYLNIKMNHRKHRWQRLCLQMTFTSGRNTNFKTPHLSSKHGRRIPARSVFPPAIHAKGQRLTKSVT